MNDQATIGAPDVFGNGALERSSQHHVRRVQRNRFARHVVVDVELDRQLVPTLGKLDIESLREAVEAMDEEQDAHRAAQQIRGSCSPDSQSTIRPPPKAVVICTKR